jgi:hypothetical protein
MRRPRPDLLPAAPPAPCPAAGCGKPRVRVSSPPTIPGPAIWPAEWRRPGCASALRAPWKQLCTARLPASASRLGARRSPLPGRSYGVDYLADYLGRLDHPALGACNIDAAWHRLGGKLRPYIKKVGRAGPAACGVNMPALRGACGREAGGGRGGQAAQCCRLQQLRCQAHGPALRTASCVTQIWCLPGISEVLPPHAWQAAWRLKRPVVQMAVRGSTLPCRLLYCVRLPLHACMLP